MNDTQTLPLSHGVLDLTAGEFRTDAQTTKLTPREVTLLRCLAERPGEPVDQRALLARFGLTESSRGLVTDWVRRLRKKIEPDPKKPTVLLRYYGGKLMLQLAKTPEPISANDLPAPPLVGRGEGLQTLHRRLSQGQRVLTLVGPPGVGKTRLARTLAAEATASERYLQRVVFCELAACRRPQEALSVMARQIGLILQGNTSLNDIVGTLGQALSQMGSSLWVLDNLEHLIDDLRAPLAALFRLGPRVQWVLTSRHRLGVDAEQVVPVGGLAPAEGAELLTHRIQALGGTIPAKADSQLLTLSEILDGSPLAILMAAARLANGVWADELASLTASLGSLMEGEDSLHGTLEWSWNLLSPADRDALTQCALFRGGFTMDLAEEVVVVHDHWVDDVLMSLVDHSMIWVRPEEDGPRLDLYESVRAFVLNRQPEPDEALARRFVQTMGRLNTGGRASLTSMDAEVVRTERLERELPNLAVAQELARSRPMPETQWVLDAFSWMWVRQGRVVPLKEAMEAWLAEALSSDVRRHAQRIWVQQCLHLRDVEAPKALVDRLASQVQGGDTDVAYLESLAPVLEYTLRVGPLASHITLAESCLAELEVPVLQRARLQHTLGIAYRKEGRVEEGVEMQRRALSAPGHANWKIQARSALAVGLVFLRQIHDAVPVFEEVYEWQKRYGGALHQIAAATNFGRVCLLDGQHERGWRVLQQGWERSLTLAPMRLCEACGLNYVGACLIMGRDSLAADVLAQALDRAEQLDTVHVAATLLSLRAAHGARQGDSEGFERDWETAMEHLREGWMLNDEEITAMQGAYRTLMAATSGDWTSACGSVREILARPYIGYTDEGLTCRVGSDGHRLHVTILQAWIASPAIQNS